MSSFNTLANIAKNPLPLGSSGRYVRGLDSCQPIGRLVSNVTKVGDQEIKPGNFYKATFKSPRPGEKNGEAMLIEEVDTIAVETKFGLHLSFFRTLENGKAKPTGGYPLSAFSRVRPL